MSGEGEDYGDSCEDCGGFSCEYVRTVEQDDGTWLCGLCIRRQLERQRQRTIWVDGPDSEAARAAHGSHAYPCMKELDRLSSEAAYQSGVIENFHRGHNADQDTIARLRAEVERLRSELALAIDEAEHGHRCSFCGCDLTGPSPWTHSQDCMVSSMRDALAREGGAA